MKLACPALLLSAIAPGVLAFTAPRPLHGPRASAAAPLAVTQGDLDGAQSMVEGIIQAKNCGPVFVRLAWHDSGTFDVSLTDTEAWPKAGGAIGSIRFDPEINHGANAGLAGAVKLLEPVKEAYPAVSYADLFQMASARSSKCRHSTTSDAS